MIYSLGTLVGCAVVRVPHNMVEGAGGGSGDWKQMLSLEMIIWTLTGKELVQV